MQLDMLDTGVVSIPNSVEEGLARFHHGTQRADQAKNINNFSL